MSNTINPNNLPLGKDFKLAKTPDKPEESKTIDLSVLNKEEDLEKINLFIDTFENKNVNKKEEIKNWNIKIGNEYIDLTSSPDKALKWVKQLKESIQKGDIFKAQVKKIDGQNASEVFFSKVDMNTFNTEIGKHDTDGYTFNLFDNTWINPSSADSDLESDMILGKKLQVFTKSEDAEKWSRNHSGTEVIIRNKEGFYEVFQVNRRANPDEYANVDKTRKIEAADFTNNHSRFTTNVEKMSAGTHAFIVTDDNKTLAISGKTAVEVGSADYNVIGIKDLNAELLDINGLETDAKGDLHGSLNGTISLDLKTKLEETLNSLKLPDHTRINVNYDPNEKAFYVSVNYELLGSITALKLKPEANGSLSVSALGIADANVNLNDGVAVDANVGIPFFASIGVNGEVSLKEEDKIKANANVKGTIPVVAGAVPFPGIPFQKGQSLTLERNGNGTYNYSENVKLTDNNIFPDLKVDGKWVPGFVEKKTGSWEKDAHASIAGGVISFLKTLESGGFKVPENLKKIDPNNLKEEDKKALNDFVNGKTKLEFDLDKLLQTKGFKDLTINSFDPNITFNTDGGKLNVVFNNAEMIASTDGKGTLAVPDVNKETNKQQPDKISIKVNGNINNLSTELNSDISVEAHVDKDEKDAFAEKLNSFGMNTKGAKISGDFDVNVETDAKSDSPGLENLTVNNHVDLKADNLQVDIPDSKVQLNLKKATATGDLDITEENNKMVINAKAKVSLSSSTIKKEGKKIADIGPMSFTGKMYYEQKDKKTSIITQGHADISKARYDNMSVKGMAVDGILAYTENEGISVKSTSEAGLRLKGHFENTEQNISLDLNKVNGYGRFDFDKDGNIKDASVKGNADISGNLYGKSFILKSKINTDIGINSKDNQVTIDLKGSVEKLVLGDISLENMNKINAKITYDSVNNQIKLEASNGEPLDISGKINGSDFNLKGNATVLLTIDKQTGKLTIVPDTKLDLLKYGTFEMTNAELKGAKITTEQIKSGSKEQKLSIESVETDTPFEFKADFNDNGTKTPVSIKCQGKVDMNSSVVNNKNTFSITSDAVFPEFTIGASSFKDAKLDGNIIFEGNKFILAGKDASSMLKFEGKYVEGDKTTDFNLEATGEVSIEKSTIPNDKGYTLTCRNGNIKNATINDYHFNDFSINGKLVYFNDGTNKNVTLTGLDDKDKDSGFSVCGKISKDYIDKSTNEKKTFNSDIQNVTFSGGMTFSDNKIIFNNTTADVQGTVNGVPVNMLIGANGDGKGNTGVFMSGDLDGLYIGSNLKVKSLPDGKLEFTSTDKDNKLSLAVSDKLSIEKIIGDLKEIIPSANFGKQLADIEKQLKALKESNVKVDLKDVKIIFDPKAKTIKLDSDVEGFLSAKVAFNPNKEDSKSDFDLKASAITGKLSADSEKNQLNITDGKMKGSIENIETMLIDIINESLSKDTQFEKMKGRNAYKSEVAGKKTPIVVNMNTTGIGEKSEVKLHARFSLVDLNFKSKVSMEDNLLKIKMEKSNAWGVVPISIEGKTLGFIKIDDLINGFNKTTTGIGNIFRADEKKKTASEQKYIGNPYSDVAESIDIAEENTEDAYKKNREAFVKEFKQQIKEDNLSPQNQKELEKQLKAKHLDTLENYQKHTGIIQLEDDGKTIVFDLARYLSIKGSSQDFDLKFEFEDSKQLLSGKKEEDDFQLNFNLVLTNKNDISGYIPSTTPKEVSNTVTGILDQFGTTVDDIGNTLDDIRKETENISGGINDNSPKIKSIVEETGNKSKEVNSTFEDANQEIKDGKKKFDEQKKKIEEIRKSKL